MSQETCAKWPVNRGESRPRRTIETKNFNQSQLHIDSQITKWRRSRRKFKYKKTKQKNECSNAYKVKYRCICSCACSLVQWQQRWNKVPGRRRSTYPIPAADDLYSSNDLPYTPANEQTHTHTHDCTLHYTLCIKNHACCTNEERDMDPSPN